MCLFVIFYMYTQYIYSPNNRSFRGLLYSKYDNTYKFTKCQQLQLSQMLATRTFRNADNIILQKCNPLHYIILYYINTPLLILRRGAHMSFMPHMPGLHQHARQRHNCGQRKPKSSFAAPHPGES